jgi:hypothetical protein
MFRLARLDRFNFRNTHLADGTAMLPKMQGQSTSIGAHLKALLFARPGRKVRREPSAAHWGRGDLPAEGVSGAVRGEALKSRRRWLACSASQLLWPPYLAPTHLLVAGIIGVKVSCAAFFFFVPWPLRDVRASSPETRCDVQARANATRTPITSERVQRAPPRYT